MKLKTPETQLNCLSGDINITIYYALNLSKICLDVPNLPQIYYFCQFQAEIFIIFPNWHNFLSYPKGEYLPTIISGKNAAYEAAGGVNEANICPKIVETC